MTTQYYTAKEIADMCDPKRTKRRIIQLIRNGTIKNGEKVNAQFGMSYWRVPAEDALKFLTEHKKND